MVVKMEVQHQSPSSDIFSVPHIPLTESLGTANDWIAPLIPLSPPKTSNNSGIVGNSSNSSSFVDHSESLFPGTVKASGPIPQGAMTTQIEPWMLVGNIAAQQEPPQFIQITAGVTSFGTLDLDKKSKEIWTQDAHWIRAIRLSDDCHSYNVQLKFQPSYRIYPNVRGGPQPKLILQAVRPIEASQELHLWFSEDILAMLQVVFLNPSNIQGQKKYTCTRCSKLYESPNPLKLHITLGCGKLPISALWERLASLMKDNQSLRNVGTKIQDFDFKLTPETQVCKQRNALDLTVGPPNSTNNVNNKGLYRPYTECSAFKPFKKQNIKINGNTASSLNPRLIHEMPAIWPITFETDVVQLHRNLMHNQALSNAQNIYSDDAQIESLVSSLGKAKQGHICLYCGKCYSRKYGLKIHIRTHTGYKPLRCKFCDRPFGDPSNLNKHVRLHAEGNTPYKCDLCGKILVRRRDLERHLKSRHMVEMHPGQNMLPDSLASTEDAGALTENADNETEQIENDKSDSLNENIDSLDGKSEETSQLNEEDQEVKIIDIHKEEILESDGDIEISLG